MEPADGGSLVQIETRSQAPKGFGGFVERMVAPGFLRKLYADSTDNVITMHPIIAKNPAAMAPDVSMIYSYKFEGDTLTVTAQRDRNGPVANPFTVKLVRIE